MHADRLSRLPIVVCTCLALTAALLLAGCGSSYTKRDYAQQAEGICSSTLHSVRVLTPPSVTGSARARDAALAAYIDRILPLMHRQLRRLNALPRPTETRADSGILARYVTALRLSVAQFQMLDAAARAGQSGAVTVDEALLAANAAPRLAAAYGLKACSSSAATYN